MSNYRTIRILVREAGRAVCDANSAYVALRDRFNEQGGDGEPPESTELDKAMARFDALCAARDAMPDDRNDAEREADEEAAEAAAERREDRRTRRAEVGYTE
jgi:hypothetical protein